MPSAVNAPCKPSMSACSLSPTRSWPCSDGNACLSARALWPLSRGTRPGHGRGSANAFPESSSGWPTGRVGRSRAGCGTGREHSLVFDVDGTEASSPTTSLAPDDRPSPAQRRLRDVCAAFRISGASAAKWSGRGRASEPPHTHQWLGTFSGAGNGDYRGELLRALEPIKASLEAQHLPLDRAVVRFDGQYGNGAIVAERARAGLGGIMRGKDDQLL